MAEPRTSYQKVAYDLRPAKQIERRMIINTFQIMAEAGFPIRTYQYTGMGSIFFVDFILFHKLLGINKLLSVEKEDDDRADFNCPFKRVEVIHDEIGTVIPSLKTDRRHILWLDYDNHLNESCIQDIRASAAQLTVGSILLVTVDVHNIPALDSASKRFDYYKNESGVLFRPEWTIRDFSLENDASAMTNAKIISSAIHNGLAGRDTAFYQLFNFIYADGHTMITFGGLIADENERRKLDNCEFKDNYMKRDLNKGFYRIIVPILTRKERQYLDKFMPCDDGFVPKDFNLDQKYIHEYREVYRFYPSYVEMLY